jgi:hypothetical protein
MKPKPIDKYKCANRCGKQASFVVGSMHKVCSMDCAIELANKKKAKKEELEAKKERQEHKQKKKEIRARNVWFGLLQKEVNYYVLHVRDKGKPCCTCGATHDIKYDAGHYRSVGACKELRFELKNIHKQCSVKCNQWGSGMRSEYREFITCVYGKETLEWLDGPHKSLKDQFPHWTDIEKEVLRYRELNRNSKRENN